MTKLDAGLSTQGFGMANAGLVPYVTYVNSSQNHFSWNSANPGGSYAPPYLIAYGSAVALDGAQNPTGGDMHTVQINLDNNPSIAGIDNIFDVYVTAPVGTTFSLPSFISPIGTNANVATDIFWSALLNGDDEIIAPRLGSAQMFGDFYLLSDVGAGERWGGSDSFTADSVPAADIGGTELLVGDAFYVDGPVAAAVILHGGNDSFVLSGYSHYAVAGDALSVTGATATVAGGNDTITSNVTSGEGTTADPRPLVGDVYATSGGKVSGGADTITGSDAAGLQDRLIGDISGQGRSESWGGADLLSGRAGDDVLIGDTESFYDGRVNGGNDTLRGGLGDDLLVGDVQGQLPDIYNAPSTSVGGHDLLEGGDGADTLIGDVQNAYFGPEHGRIAGGNDTLLGGAGEDTLYGDLANLTQYANARFTITGGNDLLNGGAGRDIMVGGDGNDRYVVNDVGDVVDETGTGGRDTILVGFTFALRNTSGLQGDVENLILTGTGNFKGTGNTLANLITGNKGNNQLEGGGANDTLIGGAGKDKLLGSVGVDTASYASASKGVRIDLNNLVDNTGDAKGDIYSSIERILGSDKSDNLRGNHSANRLDGGRADDSVSGGDGNDTVNGGAGRDALSGGSDNDRFVFNAAIKSSNADRIADFSHDHDLIQLDDAVFTKIGPTLSAAEFYAAKGAVKAHDASDRIIYDKASGRVFYDDDGKGGHNAVLFATLSNKPQTFDAGDVGIV